MIALISIPHQRPAKINWYDDRDDLVRDAFLFSAETDRPHPEDFDDAVCCLADNWHGHLLVESADDLADVLAYARSGRHQAHRVGALAAEIHEMFDITS